jgi:adenosine/AMP kinase
LDCGSLLPLFRGSPAAAEVSMAPKKRSAGAQADALERIIRLECSTASRLAYQKRQQAAAVHVTLVLMESASPMNILQFSFTSPCS